MGKILLAQQSIKMRDLKLLEKDYMDKSWKEESHQIYKSENIDKSVKAFYDFLKNNKIKGSLLDIGCGNGKNTVFFSKKGFNSLGIDFSKEAIKICKQKDSDANFKVADILDFKPEEKFDIVIDCGCLHHIRRSFWNEYRKTILNSLKIGGFYYIHGIADSKGNKKLPKHPDKRNWIINNEGHYTTFINKKDINNLLGKNFEIIEENNYMQKSKFEIVSFIVQRKK